MASDTDRIYIEILETVLMATLDPDLWKSALQKLAFLTGSALMEL
ncbi:transcriptional regulator, partial [Klebsiella pneumoniae subsp. pneumoniae]